MEYYYDRYIFIIYIIYVFKDSDMKAFNIVLMMALVLSVTVVTSISTSMSVHADEASERCNDNLDRHIAAGGRHGERAQQIKDSGLCG